MKDEMTLLTPEQHAAVHRVISAVRADGGYHKEDLPDGGDAYAYQGAGGIHWGVNDGVRGWCVARGKVVQP